MTRILWFKLAENIESDHHKVSLRGTGAERRFSLDRLVSNTGRLAYRDNGARKMRANRATKSCVCNTRQKQKGQMERKHVAIVPPMAPNAIHHFKIPRDGSFCSARVLHWKSWRAVLRKQS